MLKHSIHTSLTRTQQPITKEATLCFKNCLGFMGDKVRFSVGNCRPSTLITVRLQVMSFPAMLARETIEKGLQMEGLRDEIYVQLIKQTTENPNP